MTRSERLLAILQALRGRRLPITAAALATQFEVSERTIYRDMATLLHRGAIIEGSAGFGYVLRRDYFLPPLTFSKEEAAALLLGLRFVGRRGDDALAEAASAAQAKLEAVSPDAFRGEHRLTSPLIVGPRASRNTNVLRSVRQALSRGRKLRFRYTNAEGATSKRVVWPIVLGWFDGLEMLAAWCEKRKAFRHFRVDRMQSVTALDEPPEVSRRKLLADYRLHEPVQL